MGQSMSDKFYSRFKLDVKIAAPFVERDDAFAKIKDVVSNAFANASTVEFRHKQRGRAGSNPRYLDIDIEHASKQDWVLIDRHLAKSLNSAGFNDSYKHRVTGQEYATISRRSGLSFR